jgi:hypothetical protein
VLVKLAAVLSLKTSSLISARSKFDRGIIPSRFIAINFAMMSAGVAAAADERRPLDHVGGPSASGVIFLLLPIDARGFVLKICFLPSSAVFLSDSGIEVAAAAGTIPLEITLPSCITAKISYTEMS